jgi:hypothetical protein
MEAVSPLGTHRTRPEPSTSPTGDAVAIPLRREKSTLCNTEGGRRTARARENPGDSGSDNSCYVYKRLFLPVVAVARPFPRGSESTAESTSTGGSPRRWREHHPGPERHEAVAPEMTSAAPGRGSWPRGAAVRE